VLKGKYRETGTSASSGERFKVALGALLSFFQ
jgi:hypothetical protein